MSKISSGVIIGHRGITPNTQKPKEYLIQFSNVKSASEAGQLIGRKVAWPLGKKVRRKDRFFAWEERTR
jgi:ribosomal protein L35AE/L33A